jgi:hypothetical protein
LKILLFGIDIALLFCIDLRRLEGEEREFLSDPGALAFYGIDQGEKRTKQDTGQGVHPMAPSAIPARVVLLFSHEENFTQALRDYFEQHHQLHLIAVQPKEFRTALRWRIPLLILWDQEPGQSNPEYVLQWLRDHFTKRPIIALVKQGERAIMSGMCNKGINFVLDRSKEDFFDSLGVFTTAVLADRTAIYG